MNIKPLFDKVVVEAANVEEKTKSGFILPASAQEKPQTCVVVAVGPGGVIDGKEVTTQVSEGSVDAGIIYGTDAFSAGLTVVDEATPEMCGQVIYPAAVLNTSSHQTEAQAFLDYLSTDEAMAVFESIGFSQVA